MRSIILVMAIGLLSVILSGCDCSPKLNPDFERCIVNIREWMELSGAQRRTLVEAFAVQYQSLTNKSVQNELYSLMTNALVRVRLCETNGVPRWKSLPKGGSQSPFNTAVESYMFLVGRVGECLRLRNDINAFAFWLEIWKFLKKKHDGCEAHIDQWLDLCDDDNPMAYREVFVQFAKSAFSGEMGTIERKLENMYSKESEESRRAYDLFRQVVGREACPRYMRRAREKEDQTRCER